MKLLLHACCAPCLIYPYNLLRNQGIDVTVIFYNPNIHPFLEFKKRADSLLLYSQKEKFPLIFNNIYGLSEFLRRVVFHENNRCTFCYEMRIESVALKAKELQFDTFSTTLLYSKYQKHDLIVSTCNSISKVKDIPFFYHDFREGWKNGINESITLNMYRQSYCGCIYSEQERYDKSLKNKKVL